MTSPIRALPAGDAATTLGGYELVLELASHETTVLLARRTGPRSFSRWVTIRYVGPFAGAQSTLDAIDRDVERASQVRHPCVLPIHEAGALANGRFIVSDYIEGGTLFELAQACRVPPAIATTIVLDVLAGLEAIFRTESARGKPLGVVHGRLSSRSVVVGLDGRTRIANLGLQSVAALEDGGSTINHYEAPEVLDGGEHTQRSEVFSVGMVLYEMLRGAHPLAGAASTGDARRRLSSPLPLLSVLQPSIPAALAEVAARALALDPSHRYRTAEAFAAALERACPPMSFREVAAFVSMHLGETVEARRKLSSEWVRAHAAALGEPTPSVIARARRRARLLLIRRRRELWAVAIAGVIALWVLFAVVALR